MSRCPLNNGTGALGALQIEPAVQHLRDELGRLLPVNARGVAGTRVPATPTLDISCRPRSLLPLDSRPRVRELRAGPRRPAPRPGTGWCVARRIAGTVPGGELGFRFGEPLDVDGDGHADIAAGARFKLQQATLAERERRRCGRGRTAR